MKNNHNKTFTYAGLFGISTVYILTIIALTITLIIFQYEISLFILLLSISTIICASIALIIYLCSRHITKIDKQTELKLAGKDCQTAKRGKF